MEKRHVCPWWIGYLLLSPVRKLGQNPKKILGPLVEPGMTVLDVGSAMGFFSLPLARLVGSDGRVVCIDLQPRMLATLERRARRAGLGERIETRVCNGDHLGLDDLEGRVDFALAFAVLHEMPEVAATGKQLHSALRKGARLLVAEPAGHVDEVAFEQSLTPLQSAGFSEVGRPEISRSRSVLLQKSVPRTTR